MVVVAAKPKLPLDNSFPRIAPPCGELALRDEGDADLPEDRGGGAARGDDDRLQGF